MSSPNPRNDPENTYPHERASKMSAIKSKIAMVKKPKVVKTNIGSGISKMASDLQKRMNDPYSR